MPSTNKDREQLQYLWEQYINKTASHEVLDELFTRLQDPANEAFNRSVLEQYFATEINSENFDREYWLSKLDAIKSKTPVLKMQSRRKFYHWIAVAAVVTLFFGTWLLFIHKSIPQAAIAVVSGIKNDVAPGTSKAILTLSDGTTITLDSARNGTLATQGNTNIIKTDSGKLTYQTTKEKTEAVSFNTLSTPRGGEHQLVLSDGTLVWLNAASSITYPTTFITAERDVTITGEVYFEVTKNKSKPFRVRVNDMEVDVLGTHFNVNAYGDESALRTTLLEGSVKVTSLKSNQSKIISPGEQAAMTGDHLSVNKDVNLEEIIAWKEGSFDFESADLKTILRQFARWYDVEVVYEGTVSNRKFFAIVSRNTSLKNVLELLQDNNIRFEIDGKKLTIKSS